MAIYNNNNRQGSWPPPIEFTKRKEPEPYSQYSRDMDGSVTTMPQIAAAEKTVKSPNTFLCPHPGAILLASKESGRYFWKLGQAFLAWADELETLSYEECTNLGLVKPNPYAFIFTATTVQNKGKKFWGVFQSNGKLDFASWF